MYSGGYTGTILRIDLSEKTATREPLPLEVARDYLGGAGIGIKYLYDEVPATTEALAPENKLIFAGGPFTGTSIPCASRMAVTAKSPLTGAVGMALSGGHFPAELKLAGYDALIIEGRAENPVWLAIKDGEVRFRSAEKLWGTQSSDCQAFIKDALHDQNARVACIGPAGENLSRIACIMNERRAAGRKGLGAVMGSKNLKAIAVRGTGQVAIADEGAYKAARDDMRRQMRESPVLYEHFAKVGTPMVVDLTIGLGIFAAKNWSATGEFEPFDGLGVETQQKQSIGRNPCFQCPVACSQVKVAKTGRYQGILSEGPEFESVYSLGGATGVESIDAVIAADRLCDELGLDTMSAGVAVGFAMELAERGILSSEEAGGLDLSWGNDETMLELLRQMAFREGLGDLLSEGTKRAAEKIGGGAEDYAMHVKGLELPAYDVRGAKAHGLSYATAYTGADHCRGYAFQEIFGIPVPFEVDRFSLERKGELTKWNQDVRTATTDCPTMCAFLLDTSMPATAPENTAALLKAVSGLELSAEEVMRVGERVNNLARAFNIQAGFTRADDTLPKRLRDEPLKGGASKGQHIPQEDLDIMLDEYYAARGWTPQGVPTPEKLAELNLAGVSDQLAVIEPA
jgi:aldehyde:ferredoxin oxidoreductase